MTIRSRIITALALCLAPWLALAQAPGPGIAWMPGPQPIPPQSLYGLAGTWTASQKFTATPTIGGAAQNTATLNVSCLVATICQEQFLHSGGVRWQIQLTNDAEAGSNAGSLFVVAAADDTGTFSGNLFRGVRASGALGLGHPWFDKFSPYFMGSGRATYPNGIYGNDINGLTDVQKTIPLSGTTPFSVATGSTTMHVTLANCCGTFGPMYMTLGEVWVKLHGAATVGGVDVDTAGQGQFPGSPGPWYEVQSIVSANEFTVTLSAPAGSTASGGGAGSTAQPSFSATLNQLYTTAQSGAAGYPIQQAANYACTYDFYQLIGVTGPDCEQNYDEFYSPPETSGLYAYHSIQRETDIVNLNGDFGYATNPFQAANNVTGTWFVPYVGNATRLAQLGGTPHNIGQAITFGPGGSVSPNQRVAFYQATLVQANSIVGAGNDPTGHGGVAHDVFGSYAFLPPQPFTTAIGTAVVTVTAGRAYLFGHANGDTIYLPGSYSFDGVSFGAGDYAIANVNLAAGTFTVTGSGAGVSGVTAGGVGQAAFFDKEAPFSPISVHGEFLHGITATTNSRFEDGLFVNMQPGQGVGWSDGSGTAIIKATAPTAGNLNIVFAPAGTGTVNISGFPTSCSGLPTGTLANIAGTATFCP